LISPQWGVVRLIDTSHEKDLMTFFPLTAAQRDIWLDQLRLGDSPLYNIGGYVDLTGPMNPALIQRAIEQLVAKHDALRTVLQVAAHG